MKNISERLAYAIQSSGKSKGALAGYLGVPQSSVSRWLAGAEPRVEKLTAIAKFLGVDVNWLTTGKGAVEASEEPPAMLRDDVVEYRVKPSLDARVERLERVVEALQKALGKL